jgi:hypothetical protein
MIYLAQAPWRALAALRPLWAKGAAQKKRRRRRFRVTIDHAIAGSGVLAACCSVTFAGYMISDRTRQPYFPGIQYLSIFARPNHGVEVAAHAPDATAADSQAAKAGVDPTPTGSITAAKTDLIEGASRLRLLAANQDIAWIESDKGFRQVKPGDILPGLGRVLSITERGGRWLVHIEGGATLALASGAVNPLVSASDTRFARRMIFDAP